MRRTRLAIITVLAALGVAGSVATASASTAAPVSNFGVCQKLTTLHAAQAPGQTGNGPGTLIDSSWVSQPPAFAGWVACSRT
jgi:hypothetical protein